MKEDIKKLSQEDQDKIKSKVKKQIKKIRKMNKLYFRGKNNALGRLDNVSQDLFDLVMVKFISGDGAKLHAMTNKGVTHWAQVKPIKVEIEKQYETDFNELVRLSGQDSIVIYHNGSFIALATLTLAKK